MDSLFNSFNIIKGNVVTNYKRYLYHQIDWNDRLIAIKGSRGVGKTTLLLQYIIECLPNDETVLYISLDNIYFASNNLVDLANKFVKNGGKYLFIDEVHKYENWSTEIKNIYDIYADLKVVITSSSILQLYKGQADLSRRMMSYELHGLSLREYILFEKKIQLPTFSLSSITSEHIKIATQINEAIKPIPIFKEYLKYGYYPFYKENKSNYYFRLNAIISLVLESDLPAVKSIDYSSITKLKRLLSVIAHSVPFKPNITKISEAIGSNRNSTLDFFQFLRDARLIDLLYFETKGFSHLTKPEKVYLNNTNLVYALAHENVNVGNLRETFFQNQLSTTNAISYSTSGDFMINQSLIFEVGGENKSYKQIRNLENSFIAADDVEYGYKNKIPLWMFGFLY